MDLFITKYSLSGVTGSPGAQNTLLLGNGLGQFTDQSTGRLLPQRRQDNSSAATLRDMDNDGDLDIVVSNSLLSVSGPLSADVLWNQGSAQLGNAGFFQDGQGDLDEAPSPAESIRLGQVVADFDQDGLLDILFLVHDLPPGGMQPPLPRQGQQAPLSGPGGFKPAPSSARRPWPWIWTWTGTRSF